VLAQCCRLQHQAHVERETRQEHAPRGRRAHHIGRSNFQGRRSLRHHRVTLLSTTHATIERGNDGFTG
jgi:N-acetyl-anhydromuramyl-L-alanine amidase AmpD